MIHATLHGEPAVLHDDMNFSDPDDVLGRYDEDGVFHDITLAADLEMAAEGLEGDNRPYAALVLRKEASRCRARGLVTEEAALAAEPTVVGRPMRKPKPRAAGPGRAVPDRKARRRRTGRAGAVKHERGCELARALLKFLDQHCKAKASRRTN